VIGDQAGGEDLQDMKYIFGMLPLPRVIVYDQNEINVADARSDLAFAASAGEICGADTAAPSEHERSHPNGQKIHSAVDGEQSRAGTPGQKIAHFAFPHEVVRVRNAC
jgi:hypothetical protein